MYRALLSKISALIIILLTFAFQSNSYASHLIGGDLKYRCLGNNRFELFFVLYQDCSSGQSQAISVDNPLNFGIYTGANKNVFVMADSVRFDSVKIIPAEFSNDCISNPPSTCMQAMSFSTIVTLQPSTTGYRIIYQRCCRNANLVNVPNSGNIGVTYFIDIPPFTNGVCPNNSITFTSLPPQIICANNPFAHSFAATDIDGDSLSYRLCPSLNGASDNFPVPKGDEIVPYSNVTYRAPFSGDNPLPSNPPMAVNPITGLMTAFPTSSGRYAVNVCVDEWRNGVVINTVSREVQFTITNCSKNVIASMPTVADQPNVHAIECSSFTVNFKNSSVGGTTYLWRFGVAGATSTLQEPSFTYPDTGTYTVTLLVNPGTTCSDSITKLVKVYPYFVADFTHTGNLCPGAPVQFNEAIRSPGTDPLYYHWDFNGQGLSEIQSPIFTFQEGGNKTVRLASASEFGCLDTAVINVYIDTSVARAGNDTIVVAKYPFRLNGRGLENYLWTPSDYLSDRNIANPFVEFPDTGWYQYVLTGTTAEGCESSDTIRILVVSNPQMFLPNAFSPNGDGLNDILRPNLVGYSIIRNFEIFNRWGELMYKADNDNAMGWNGMHNGKPADVGVYYYRITYVDALTNELLEQTGDVTLLR